MHKFKPGNKIQFINNAIGYVPSYFYDGLPEHLIQHGSVQYLNNTGTVIETVKTNNDANIFVIVRYIDSNNQSVQLGFREKDLILQSNGAFCYLVKIQYLSKDGSSKKIEMLAESKEEAISKIKDLERIEFIMEEVIEEETIKNINVGGIGSYVLCNAGLAAALKEYIKS